MGWIGSTPHHQENMQKSLSTGNGARTVADVTAVDVSVPHVIRQYTGTTQMWMQASGIKHRQH